MSKPEVKTESEIGEFKDKPVFVIFELDDNYNRKPYPFSFGKEKAKKILNHIEEIKKFVESQS